MTTPIPIQPPVPAPVADPTMAVEVWAVLGTWAGAIGSISAATAAVWIALRGWRRADAERRDREKAQARLVVSRLEPSATERFSVTNHSRTDAVFNVEPSFDLRRPDSLRGTVCARELLPRDVLGPGERWHVGVMYLDQEGAVAAVADWSVEEESTIAV